MSIISMSGKGTISVEKGEYGTDGKEVPVVVDWREYCISLRFPLGVTKAFRQYAEARGEMVPVALNDKVENKVELNQDDKVNTKQAEKKKTLKIFRGIRKFFKKIFSKRQK